MAINIKIMDDVFNDVYYDYLEDQTRTQIFYGGSSSGKSVFVAERAVFDILKGGRNYLCCRNIGRTIRTSIFNELRKIIIDHKLLPLFDINKSDMLITCKNGYQILMTGLDDVEKVKSITPLKGVITDIWIEEATECLETDIKQLTKRLRGLTDGIKKRITLSFNPILRSHWIYKKYFENWDEKQTIYRSPDLLIVKTTYKDNRFLEKDDIIELENETDAYFYDVYSMGNWGILGGIIFTNWQKMDILNDPVFKTFDMFQNGLDFGYSNDPTAFNRMYYHKATKKLYIFDEWHAKAVTNPEIAQALKQRLNGDGLVCDSAEPKSITELCNEGLNASAARKGKDSVIHGIQWLQQQDIRIDYKCQETINEFEQYHWIEDKDGETLNKPIDKNNHHIDAIRYACEELMLDAGADDVVAVGQTVSSQADW